MRPVRMPTRERRGRRLHGCERETEDPGHRRRRSSCADSAPARTARLSTEFVANGCPSSRASPISLPTRCWWAAASTRRTTAATLTSMSTSTSTSGPGCSARLNILVYFNRDWKEEYGGVLDLWDEDVRHCLGRFAPIFNRAAGFATSAYELARRDAGQWPAEQDAPLVRGVYYYTRRAAARLGRHQAIDRVSCPPARARKGPGRDAGGEPGADDARRCRRTEEEAARYAFVLTGALSARRRLARVAHGQHLPLMPSGSFQ